MSSYLARLDQRIAEASDPYTRAEAAAERASYLVRLGDFQSTETTIAELQSLAGTGQPPRLAIWKILLEGLLHFYRSVDPAARDRVRRAYLLSVALDDPDLIAHSSAWMAHLDRHYWDFEGMGGDLATWCRNAGRIDPSHPTRARVELTTADALMQCGEPDGAYSAYERARSLAVAGSDQASMSAVMFNQAALGLALIELRTALAQNVPASSWTQRVRQLARSAMNYEDAAGHRVIRHFRLHSGYRLAIVEERYEDALGLLSEMLARRFGEVPDPYDACLALAAGHCAARLGHFEEAREYCASVTPGSIQALQADDRVVFWARCADLAVSASAPFDLMAVEASRTRAEDEYLAMKSRLLSAFERFQLPRHGSGFGGTS